MKRIEYRVRPVTRYIVTRWEGEYAAQAESSGSNTQRGEYDNADTAYEVGYALCRAEHETLGYPPGDERIQYPEHPRQQGAAGQAVSIAKAAYLSAAPSAGEYNVASGRPKYEHLDDVKVTITMHALGTPKAYVHAYSSYAPLAGTGETWRRGNDLADGRLNEESTLQRVFDDISAVSLGYSNAHEMREARKASAVRDFTASALAGEA